jgi:hypothetical protein
VIIFSGVPSESAELERLRPRTRLVQKPYSLTMLVEALKEMIGSPKIPQDYPVSLTADTGKPVGHVEEQLPR